MKKLLVALFLLLPFAVPAKADSLVVQTCGTLPLAYAPGATRLDTVDVNGNKCTNATGGGGSGAVFGPTAVGSAAANPPVLMGGTANGTATGNVAVAEIKAGNGAAVADPAVVVADPNVLSALTTGPGWLDMLVTNSTLPVPCKAAATWNASTGLTGTQPAGCDGSAAFWFDAGAWGGAGLGAAANFGTSPGAVGAAGVNASQFQGTTAVIAEPCQTQTKTYTPINISASGTDSTPIVAGASGKKTYVCQLILNNNAADNVAVVEATTATSCATVTAGIWGGTTAAAGFNFSANGGVSLGSGGFYVGKTATNNDDICIITSAATQLTGGILTVQQ